MTLLHFQPSNFMIVGSQLPAQNVSCQESFKTDGHEICDAILLLLLLLSLIFIIILISTCYKGYGTL